MHDLVFESETDDDAIFRCSLCGRLIGFNKAGIGSPYAVSTEAGWVPPANPELWMGPCE